MKSKKVVSSSNSKDKPVNIKKFNSDVEIAHDFAFKCYKKFKDVVKAIAMFGSSTKNLSTPKSDIDIIIIIDDCTVDWDDELVAWYREELAKLLAEKESSLHHIEAGQLKPTIVLAKKFEKVLGVAIISKEYVGGNVSKRDSSNASLTIGDIVKFKHDK